MSGWEFTINTGNPDLKPREAWNYDLSYEWYMGRGGMISVAGFIKDISNEIFTSSQQGPATTVGGVTYQNVVISSARNAAKARVKGLELSYTLDDIPFVKGLGFNANLTLLKGSFDQPMSAAAIAAGSSAARRTSGLIQQPDYIANATLFYSTGPFELRASYNRIGRAVQSVDSDTPTRDLFQEPRQQIDLQARYAIREGIELVGQVQNLTKEAFVVKQGVGRGYVNYYFPVGRTFWLGLSWKPKR
jgi:TonB-dependent receptor